MFYAYMKKYRWVILTLMLAAAIIAAVRLYGPRAAPQEFSGTFVWHEMRRDAHRYLYQACEKSHHIRTTGAFN